ncbi:FtsJ-like methyltransferase [Ceratobasidium sp. AG-Ba]|nr:FtsJ-like methyltransferase [Ceratobasidium sp. AG-Ba]QRW10845.1 FtsJ-like methyltransferase [Ceratobasidium sp. AG-Ba]
MAVALDTASWKSETLTRALMARGDCNTLSELIMLREKGEKSTKIDQYYESRRQRDTSQVDPMSYIVTFCNALRNMDQQMRFIHPKRFLDLGCAPGGYATYILRKIPGATGIGITIPVDVGGPGVHIPSDLRSRFAIYVADLMGYDLAPLIPKPSSPAQTLFPLPVESASMDLVICDARWVKHPDNLQRPWNWTRLLIAQLLIALHGVAQGGTILLRLSHVERTISGRIMLAMCRIAALVRCVKSKIFQGTRSYFYVLIQKIDRRSEQFKKLIIALEKLWYTMTFEGEEGYGRDITEIDEATITSDEELMGEEGLSKVVQLGKPVWEIQCRALADFLRKSGAL